MAIKLDTGSRGSTEFRNLRGVSSDPSGERALLMAFNSVDP